jgi:succinate-acetate transporter protein
MMSEQEHVFANPLPAGLGALAMACFGFFAMLSGKVTHDAAPILAAWLIGGFFVQLVVAIIEFRDKNMPGANVFLVFSSIFMLTGALSVSAKYFLHRAGMPFDASIEGWLWLAITMWICIVLPCFLKSPKILFILGSLLCVALFCLISLDFGVVAGRAMIAKTGAYSLLIAGILAIYLAGALSLNTHFGRQVLPITTPFVK